MKTTKTCSKSVKGTELKVGDIRSIGWKKTAVIVKVEFGQLEAGARYQEVTTDDGNTDRCWEGFLYSILVEVPMTILNSTPAELSRF
tara:strand:+ start:166 stop:426 length:261 start_codon:yes stop_codon:yes gene_type:complete